MRRLKTGRIEIVEIDDLPFFSQDRQLLSQNGRSGEEDGRHFRRMDSIPCYRHGSHFQWAPGACFLPTRSASFAAPARLFFLLPPGKSRSGGR